MASSDKLVIATMDLGLLALLAAHNLRQAKRHHSRRWQKTHRKQRPTTTAADTRGHTTQRTFTQRADNPRSTHLAHPGETRTDSNHPGCRLQRARKTKNT